MTEIDPSSQVDQPRRERAEIVYSVVIPVYRNQESLPLVIERLEALATEEISVGVPPPVEMEKLLIVTVSAPP